MLRIACAERGTDPMQQIVHIPSRRQALPASSHPAAQRQQRLTRHLHWIGLPLALVLVLLGWQTLVVVGGYQAFTLPAPGLVAARFGEALLSGLLWSHTSATLGAALSGFALALAVSLVLGYMLARVIWLERAIAPVLAALQAVPIIAVAPLIILWFDTGLQSKMLVAALITFFPMLLSIIAALRSVPRELREMALISGATRWDMLRHVELPLSLPIFFAGVRTGLSLATTGAVVGEFVSGRHGLGALINIARGRFDTPLIFVALLTLAGVTLLMYVLVSWLERALVDWEA
jgi:NitT/TauT family transport system permease protein